VLVGASAAVMINNTQARQCKCVITILMYLFILLPYFLPSTAVALHSIVLKLYMCIHLHKCCRYIQFYLDYGVDLGLLHTCRCDLVLELNMARTNFVVYLCQAHFYEAIKL